MKVSAKIFAIAGPVVVNGTVASVVYGVIYWIVRMVHQKAFQEGKPFGVKIYLANTNTSWYNRQQAEATRLNEYFCESC